MIFIFSILVGLPCSANVLLYSKVTQSHMYTCIYIFLFLTLSSIMLRHEWLDHSPQCYTAGSHCPSIPKQYFASVNPRLPVHPTPFPSPLSTTSLFSTCMSFPSVERKGPYIRFQIEVTPYGICLSPFDLPHLIWESLVPSLLMQNAVFCPFHGRVIFHCVCIPHLLNAVICRWQGLCSVQ